MSKKIIKKFLAFIIVMLAAWYLFFEVQSYLGRQAMEATGLKSTELTAALVQAKKEKKFILAEMSAIWCSTCRKLDQKVFSDEKVKQAIAKDYIFTRMEYETKEGKSFMKKHAIKGFPTLLILDDEANKILQLPLTFDAELFIDYLNDFVEMRSQ